jgi:hypothetical protein
MYDLASDICEALWSIVFAANGRKEQRALRAGTYNRPLFGST